MNITKKELQDLRDRIKTYQEIIDRQNDEIRILIAENTQMKEQLNAILRGDE